MLRNYVRPFSSHRMVTIFAVLLCCSASLVAQKEVIVGMVFDGPWERNGDVREMFQREIASLMQGEFSITFPERHRLSGEWTAESIDASLEQLLADPQVDVVLAMGAVVSSLVSRRAEIPKPVIAPFIIDVSLQDLPSVRGASGVKNLNYIALPSTIERDIRAFKQIHPFRNLAMLMSRPFLESIPGLRERAREICDAEAVQLQVIAVGRRVDDVLTELTDRIDAVYLAPLLQLADGEFDRLLNELHSRKLPTFSLLGYREVAAGVLAGLNPDIFPRLSRRVALNLQRILLGEKPEEIPYAFAAGEQLTINMSTARKIGVYPPWSVITEAALINDEREEVARVLSIRTAVAEGLRANQDLIAREQETAAGAQDVNLARANLLPQLSLSATALQIDADRASTLQPEQTVTGSISLEQVLFSDDAWANLSIQKKLQTAREYDLKGTRLDIAQAIATAYLQLLSAGTFEDVQKENLKLSRSNLELARIRASIGFSGRAEVYRWESEIAFNRKNVIEANALRNLAEIQLNRLLNRPLEEKFQTGERQLTKMSLLDDYALLLKYFDNPWSFKIFRAFLVEEGQRNSPEISQLDAAIAVRERTLKRANRSFFLPTLAAQAEFSRRLLTEGEGATSEPINDPALASILSAFDSGDDNNWSVALNLSFPLFRGGQRYAQRRQALETLAQLRSERRSLVEKVEQRIRSASHIAGASFAGIQQTREAAAAAQKNLELVVDAYSRGVLSITQLLDAQNAALVARQASENAIYDFLIDVLELERSVGRLHYLTDMATEKAFMERADAFMNAAGVEQGR